MDGPRSSERRGLDDEERRLLAGVAPLHPADGKDPDQGEGRSPADLVPESEGPLAEAILGALNVDPSKRFDAPGLLGFLGEAELDLRLRELEEARAPEDDAGTSMTDNASVVQPPGINRRFRLAASVAGVVALCLLSWSLGRSSVPSTEKVRSHSSPVGEEVAEIDRVPKSPSPVAGVSSPAFDGTTIGGTAAGAAAAGTAAGGTAAGGMTAGGTATRGTIGATAEAGEDDDSNVRFAENVGDVSIETVDPGPRASAGSSLSGSGLSRRAFRKVIAPKLQQLGLCALRAAQEDNDVIAKLRIAASGELASHSLSREVPWVVERCIGKIFEQLSFPPSAAATTHRVTIRHP